ncbi:MULTISPECIES: LacI family DNA-binding transcriptional regulator [unclassified Micromonospora]|uniref:LacI family DNA-binding transcriptional regulator n=1 Tax=unclassified Micromonospora TaxID=2617518 RepID=UPI001C2427C7|nr:MULTISPECIES: LacI family DNA-binding transcriptional regulator [unclassified Micromonospora]MBU8861666.1 LacI family DNA-binding transcriptional regulator [Micromonospora sp. WMMB482]MDM4781235.1 LacI family DNA-binding transcriptional regulator [Micromonospora sp. b486]
MRDVARLAGVSPQTVSRVINRHPHVMAATRQRVLDAMRELDYRRNPAARALVTRRSGTVGIIGYESPLFGPTSTLYAIEGAARSAGYFVSVASVRHLNRRSVLDAIDWLGQQSVEGIIAIAPKSAMAGALAEASPTIACVTVGGGSIDAVPSTRIDNVAGARLATRHLLELGHRTVHLVAGPDDWPEASERHQGWCDALREAGRPLPSVISGDWSARAGYEQGGRLAVDPSVTAVFCASDQLALGVLRALHEAGRRVPEDVSVVGFDGTPDGAHYLPPLTTVCQDFAELGRLSLGLLLSLLDDVGPPVSRRQLLVPELVIRHSTAAFRVPG